MKPVIQFTILDWIPLAGYILFLLYLGLKPHPEKAEESFILSARKLTLPAFIATIVSTWYGGILGVGEFTYLYGIANWFVFGLPYYIFAYIFARFLLPGIKKEHLITLPELFLNKYNKIISIMVAIFVYFITNPSPYILMAALMVLYFIPLPLWVALILVVLFSTIYLIRGGFSSVVKTDIFQFILMFIGFAIIFPFAYVRLGDLSTMWKHLPETHKIITGGNSWAYILVWYLMAMVTLVDPNFYQRVFAAKSLKIARKGIYISIGFWFLFDLMTTTAGLYARAFLTIEQPVLSYPYLANQVLPPFLKGIFVVSLLATIMSSLDSFTFSSSITLSRDILARIWPGKSYQNFFVFSLLVTLLMSSVLVLFSPSVIKLWYLIATLSIPPILIPIILLYWIKWKPPARVLMYGMILSTLGAFIDFVLALIHHMTGSYFIKNSEPMFTGIIINLLIYGGYYFLSRRN